MVVELRFNLYLAHIRRNWTWARTYSWPADLGGLAESKYDRSGPRRCRYPATSSIADDRSARTQYCRAAASRTPTTLLANRPRLPAF